MCFNIEYSCHTITNIKQDWQLSLQLMTNCREDHNLVITWPNDVTQVLGGT